MPREQNAIKNAPYPGGFQKNKTKSKKHLRKENILADYRKLSSQKNQQF